MWQVGEIYGLNMYMLPNVGSQGLVGEFFSVAWLVPIKVKGGKEDEKDEDGATMMLNKRGVEVELKLVQRGPFGGATNKKYTASAVQYFLTCRNEIFGEKDVLLSREPILDTVDDKAMVQAAVGNAKDRAGKACRTASADEAARKQMAFWRRTAGHLLK